MKKINNFSLFFIILVFGLFFITGIAKATPFVTSPTVVWNTPFGTTLYSDPSRIGAEWTLIDSFSIEPGETTQFSGSVIVPTDANTVKLEYSTVQVFSNTTGELEGTYLGASIYKSVFFGGIVTGSYTIATCSNSTIGIVTINVYIDSPLPPPHPPVSCPENIEICIESTTTTQPIVSPTINCPVGEGYVYQDGICIKSTVIGLQNCGDDTRQPPEECDGTDLSGCSVNEYCIPHGQINECTCASSLTVNLLEPNANYCSGIIVFNWETIGDIQTAYQIQISTDVNFTNEYILADSGVVSGVAGTATSRTFNVSLVPTSSCAPGCTRINYGVPYYWRVQVWGGTGGSGWTTYPTGYIYPYPHPPPLITYEPPAIVVPIHPVTFTDTSVCYENSTCQDSGGIDYPCILPYYCNHLIPADSNCTVLDGNCRECTAAPDSNGDGRGDCYSWWFNDSFSGPADDYTIGNPSHNYSSASPAGNPYQTKLKICDDIMCCSAQNPVNVSANSGSVVPQWWEITPYNQ